MSEEVTNRSVGWNQTLTMREWSAMRSGGEERPFRDSGWWEDTLEEMLEVEGGQGDHQQPQSRSQADGWGQEQTSTAFSDGARLKGQVSLQLYLHLGCQKYLSQIGCL